MQRLASHQKKSLWGIQKFSGKYLYSILCCILCFLPILFIVCEDKANTNYIQTIGATGYLLLLLLASLSCEPLLMQHGFLTAFPCPIIKTAKFQLQRNTTCTRIYQYIALIFILSKKVYIRVYIQVHYKLYT